MKVKRLKINNFRGIKQAEILFFGHTLFLGGNNVGKSTVCEALDLALGPDRLNRFPAVEEFDFYNAKYKDAEGNPILLQIEVVLADLSDEVANLCSNHTEFWHNKENRLLQENEIKKVDEDETEQCLRVITIGKYEEEEDEFHVKSFFSHSPDEEEGELTLISRNIKRLFGFLYLRAMRTGSRALSLERGSLLDIILRTKKIRTGLWEETRNRLQCMQPPIEEGAAELKDVLRSIETKLGNYVQIDADSNATELFISKLTREHLRSTISFFLKMSKDQEAVPFQQVGTGTLNILVLALLSFIAEIKEDDVIFAMEEPEIALPPHTQRRIAHYLLNKTRQSFITTHSPYVIELFKPEQIVILNRNEQGIVEGNHVSLSAGMKEKTFSKHLRRGIAEALLSKGIILGEGATELFILQAASQKMEENDSNLPPLDLTGVTLFSADGDGNITEFGYFFRSLNIPTFAFYDKKKRKEEENQARQSIFNYNYETQYSTMEELLIEEIPQDHLWTFLCHVKNEDKEQKYKIPDDRPSNEDIKTKAKSVLKNFKGDGRCAMPIRLCTPDELPPSVRGFLEVVYSYYQDTAVKVE